MIFKKKQVSICHPLTCRDLGKIIVSKGRLNIRMLSYQYRYSHYKDNTVSWRSYRYDGAFFTLKGCLYTVLCNRMMTSSFENISALQALCAESSSVTGEFPSQRPVTRSFDVFFDLRHNKRLSKQSRCRWFETPLCPLWRHWNTSWLSVLANYLPLDLKKSRFSDIYRESCQWYFRADWLIQNGQLTTLQVLKSQFTWKLTTSQWEPALLCNNVSRWLGACLKSFHVNWPAAYFHMKIAWIL